MRIYQDLSVDFFSLKTTTEKLLIAHRFKRIHMDTLAFTRQAAFFELDSVAVML